MKTSKKKTKEEVTDGSKGTTHIRVSHQAKLRIDNLGKYINEVYGETLRDKGITIFRTVDTVDMIMDIVTAVFAEKNGQRLKAISEAEWELMADSKLGAVMLKILRTEE